MKTGIAIVSLALLLSACASLTTTALKPTDITRSGSTDEKITATRFRTLQQPSATTPNLVLTVLKQATQEETFQRRHIEKRTLKPGARAALWLGGVAIAAGGYYLYDYTGLVRLRLPNHHHSQAHRYRPQCHHHRVVGCDPFPDPPAAQHR